MASSRPSEAATRRATVSRSAAVETLIEETAAAVPSLVIESLGVPVHLSGDGAYFLKYVFGTSAQRAVTEAEAEAEAAAEEEEDDDSDEEPDTKIVTKEEQEAEAKKLYEETVKEQEKTGDIVTGTTFSTGNKTFTYEADVNWFDN